MLSNLGRFSRTELLLGEEGMEKLANSTVAIFGVGGVGSFVAEGLARAGVGHLVLIDNDLICLTNINRQIHATSKTVGQAKTQVMKERILDINPRAVVDTIEDFYLPENANDFDLTEYDYIVDAVDTVTAKLALAQNAGLAGVPIISAMGTGNKLDPFAFRIADIYQTSVCPLARIMRKECRKRGIRSLKCLYSTEEALVPLEEDPEEPTGRRQTPSSNAFVPGCAGLMIAGEVIRDLTEGIRP